MANRYLTCAICGKTFVSIHKRKYCSPECKDKRAYKLPTAKCLNCGIEFGAKAYHGRQKFCSRDCRWAHERKTSTKRTALICEVCGEEFIVPKSRIKWGNPRFCSLACANSFDFRRHNDPVDRAVSTCEKCGKNFEHRITEPRKFCSQECANVLLKITDKEYRRLRAREWERISDTIIERDGNKCSVCGKTKGLVVHHITPWRVSQDDNPLNLITLCRSCHYFVEWRGLDCPRPTRMI